MLTRTHDLEWFGPPERNTLRPLGDVLFLVVYNLTSAGPWLSPSLRSSSGAPSFYRPRGSGYIGRWGPDRWAQRDCVAYCAEYSTTTVVANLSSDMLPHTADSLT